MPTNFQSLLSKTVEAVHSTFCDTDQPNNKHSDFYIPLTDFVVYNNKQSILNFRDSSVAVSVDATLEMCITVLQVHTHTFDN